MFIGLSLYTIYIHPFIHLIPNNNNCAWLLSFFVCTYIHIHIDIAVIAVFHEY